MNLTILLIRQDLKSDEDILEDIESLENISLELPDGDTGLVVSAKLYFERRPMRLPPWAEFFSALLDTSQLPRVLSAPAELIVGIDGRTFTLVFSRGQSLLQSGTFDPTFGLRVALNSINPVKMRSYDKRRFDALFRQTREQASKEAKLEDFGIDAERDLVRTVSGKPEDPRLGSSMSGGPSLRVATKIKPKQLVHFLRRLNRKSNQDKYLADYPWLGRIKEVLDGELKKTLDSYLDDKLESEPEAVWLAVPEIIDWSATSGFRFILPNKCNLVFPDISFEHLARALERRFLITVELLRRQRLEMLDIDDQPLKRWKLYDCVNGEVTLDSETYVLSSGAWYQIDFDLLSEIDREISTLGSYSFDFPEYTESDRDEYDYNKRVAQEYPTKFCCLDRENIMFGGGRNRFELCDLLSHEGELIHVKRYGGSSVLSHLFAQGMISGDLLMRRPSFRKHADELAWAHDFPMPMGRSFADKVSRRVVYAIIGGPANRNDSTLPIFSRINLRNAIRSLRGFDWEVQLAFISESEILQKRVRRKTRTKGSGKTGRR